MACIECLEPGGHPCAGARCLSEEIDQALSELREAQQVRSESAISQDGAGRMTFAPGGSLADEVTGAGVAVVGPDARRLDATLRLQSVESQLRAETTYQSALEAELTATRRLLTLLEEAP